MEAGQLELENISFDLRVVIADLEAGLAQRARDKGLVLAVEFPAAIPSDWQGDAHRLRQVLVNLLENALKFTARGQIRLRVERPAQPEGDDHLLFSVQDTGIGMSSEQQARLFERFSQADTSVARRYGGSGLGLSITKGLVEQMGGRIWLESAPNQGTTFFFTLPRPPTPPITLPATAAAQPALPPTGSGPSSNRRFRVLLAEDYEANRLIIGRQLQEAPLELEMAENGQLAIEMFQRSHYDLVLMDMQMPEMDGLSATRLIRRWEQVQGRSATPILALTASARMEDREDCFAAGCTGFVAKPVRKSELLDAIRSALQQSPPNRGAPDSRKRSELTASENGMIGSTGLGPIG